jgi:hypothetical protein
MKITLRSPYKVKEYHFQPLKGANGMNLPFVKKVRYDHNGNSEMILSEAERNDPDSIYFIPEDMDIVVTEGTTFDLDNPYEKNLWEAIKDSELIAPTRDSRDNNGDLIIDGNRYRYGRAELYVDIPGEQSERSVNKRMLITKAWTYIEGDSVDGRLTKCKLLGKNLKHAPSSDVQDYLYTEAEKNPEKIIDLYTNGDTALKLLCDDAKEKGVVKKVGGLYVYGESVLGATDDAMILFFKTAANKAILDLIKRETYPEFIVGLEAPAKKTKKTTEE